MKDTCATCKYFVQHYRKWGAAYHKVFCGHCPHPRLKRRRSGDTCPRWTPITENAPPSI